MGRKKKENAVNTEVKAVKKAGFDMSASALVKSCSVMQTAKVAIDGLGEGRLTLKGLYYTEDSDAQPDLHVLEFYIESKGYTVALRCFDRFMDAWRSYRRFVCLSKEGGR